MDGDRNRRRKRRRDSSIGHGVIQLEFSNSDVEGADSEIDEIDEDEFFNAVTSPHSPGRPSPGRTSPGRPSPGRPSRGRQQSRSSSRPRDSEAGPSDADNAPQTPPITSPGRKSSREHSQPAPSTPPNAQAGPSVSPWSPSNPYRPRAKTPETESPSLKQRPFDRAERLPSTSPKKKSQEKRRREKEEADAKAEEAAYQAFLKTMPPEKRRIRHAKDVLDYFKFPRGHVQVQDVVTSRINALLDLTKDYDDDDDDELEESGHGRKRARSNGSDSTAEIEPSAKKKKKKSSSDVEVPDLSILNPQPVQLTFEQHPLEDYTDEWFIESFRDLYLSIKKFLEVHFCIHDLNIQEDSEPWAVNHTPEFLNYVLQVAEQDPEQGGWDGILRDPNQRKWLLMGILTRILELKVFDEDLWGATKEEKELLFAIEKATFAHDGFSRTNLRSETVRTILGPGPVTENFHAETAKLTAQVSLLLKPLSDFFYAMKPPTDCKGKPTGQTLPPFWDQYQALHTFISKAAYLSLCVRLSPTIFYFTPLSPNDPFQPDDQVDIENDLYTLSKQKIVDDWAAEIKPWDEDRVALHQDVQQLTQTWKASYGGQYPIQGQQTVAMQELEQAQADLAAHLDAKPVSPYHRALIDWTKKRHALKQRIKELEKEVAQDDREESDGEQTDAVERLGQAKAELEAHLLEKPKQAPIDRRERIAWTQQRNKLKKRVRELEKDAASDDEEGADGETADQLEQAKAELDVHLQTQPGKSTAPPPIERAVKVAWLDRSMKLKRRIQELEMKIEQDREEFENLQGVKADLAAHLALRPTPIPHRCLVKIAAWPNIRRFKPGSTEEGKVPGMALEQKTGFRIFEVTKSVAVFNFGVDAVDERTRELRVQEHVDLMTLVREKQGMYEKVSSEGTGILVPLVLAMTGLAASVGYPVLRDMWTDSLMV